MSETVKEPGPHDVLLGRGGGTNNHSGNKKFRKLINEHKMRYLACSKVEKPNVAREVVAIWRKLVPAGRFLAKQNPGKEKNTASEVCVGEVEGTTVWVEVGEKKAQEKASQCLRERTPDVLPFVKQLKEQQDAERRMLMASSSKKLAKMKAEEATQVTPEEKDRSRKASKHSRAEDSDIDSQQGGNKKGKASPHPSPERLLSETPTMTRAIQRRATMPQRLPQGDKSSFVERRGSLPFLGRGNGHIPVAESCTVSSGSVSLYGAAASSPCGMMGPYATPNAIAMLHSHGVRHGQGPHYPYPSSTLSSTMPADHHLVALDVSAAHAHTTVPHSSQSEMHHSSRLGHRADPAAISSIFVDDVYHQQQLKLQKLQLEQQRLQQQLDRQLQVEIERSNHIKISRQMHLEARAQLQMETHAPPQSFHLQPGTLMTAAVVGTRDQEMFMQHQPYNQSRRLPQQHKRQSQHLRGVEAPGYSPPKAEAAEPLLLQSPCRDNDDAYSGVSSNMSRRRADPPCAVARDLFDRPGDQDHFCHDEQHEEQDVILSSSRIPSEIIRRETCSGTSVNEGGTSKRKMNSKRRKKEVSKPQAKSGDGGDPNSELTLAEYRRTLDNYVANNEVPSQFEGAKIGVDDTDLSVCSLSSWQNNSGNGKLPAARDSQNDSPRPDPPAHDHPQGEGRAVPRRQTEIRRQPSGHSNFSVRSSITSVSGMSMLSAESSAEDAKKDVKGGKSRDVSVDGVAKASAKHFSSNESIVSEITVISHSIDGLGLDAVAGGE